MAVNEVLLRQVMGLIRDNPRRWDQRSYVTRYMDIGFECRTTYCLAGWAYLVGVGDPCAAAEPYRIHDVAQTVLGLRDDQADELFRFTTVWSPSQSRFVHPTFKEFAEHVADVTGVDVLAPVKAVPATAVAVPARGPVCVGG